jgi:hypothetical protein
MFSDLDVRQFDVQCNQWPGSGFQAASFLSLQGIEMFDDGPTCLDQIQQIKANQLEAEQIQMMALAFGLPIRTFHENLHHILVCVSTNPTSEKDPSDAQVLANDFKFHHGKDVVGDDIKDYVLALRRIEAWQPFSTSEEIEGQLLIHLQHHYPWAVPSEPPYVLAR